MAVGLSVVVAQLTLPRGERGTVSGIATGEPETFGELEDRGGVYPICPIPRRCSITWSAPVSQSVIRGPGTSRL